MTADTNILAQLSDHFPGLQNRLERMVTPDRTRTYLRQIADTLCPSQTVALTRAPVVRQLLADDPLVCNESLTFTEDYGRSGSSVLQIGASAPDVWLASHLDAPSYLIEEPVGGRYRLTPFCYHLTQSSPWPAAALRCTESGSTRIVSRGSLITEGDSVFFAPEPQLDGPAAKLGPGTRVVFDFPLQELPDGRLAGMLDNAAGATAVLLACGVLSHYPVRVIAALVDEEEGPSGVGNQTFARGSQRLFRVFPPPLLAVSVDTHEVLPGGVVPGVGATFCEKSSQGRGAVTPPHLYARLLQLSAALADWKITMTENRSYIARSDCVSMMQYTPNIALVGLPVSDRHFDRAIPGGQLSDVINLAKSLVCLVMLTHLPDIVANEKEV